MEYLDQRKPRLPDFTHTAPAYDQVTQPTVAPYPAACVEMGKTCKCYTQQATLMQVTASVCVQIVRQGFFVDWQQPQQRENSQAERARPQLVSDTGQREAPRSVPMPGEAAKAPQPTVSEWSQALATRNAQVRSQFAR